MRIIPNTPLNGSSFAVGQICVFRNRHTSGMSQFDNKKCKVVDVLPQEFWLEKGVPEYRVQFLEYSGKLNSFKVEEHELEPLPN